jgi:hypothetical protein
MGLPFFAKKIEFLFEKLVNGDIQSKTRKTGAFDAKADI